jgi:hypothetical protein
MVKLKICVASLLFLVGCSYGVLTKSSTLMEKPFAVVTMRGNITEATRCVGRYWQNYSIQEGGSWWRVQVESYQVIVTGPSGEAIGLVIDFEEIEGKTMARAHVHHAFSQTDTRRTVTLKALDFCRLRDNTQSYYEGIKAIVLKNGDIMEGQVIYMDDEIVKIRTKEGKISAYSVAAEVKKIIKE